MRVPHVVSIGTRLGLVLKARSALTCRTGTDEILFLVRLGLRHFDLPPIGRGGATRLSEARGLYHEGDAYIREVYGPKRLWDAFTPLIEACRYVCTPEKVRGAYDKHFSRVLRVLVWQGLRAVYRNPTLDPLPARRRRFEAYLRSLYGFWDRELPDYAMYLEEDAQTSGPPTV